MKKYIFLLLAIFFLIKLEAQTLQKNAFIKLPIGHVQAKGWLRNQLDLQAQGLTGKLDEIWVDVGPNSAWLGGTGEDWERGPYYLRGLASLAYVNKDPEMRRKVKPWIEYTLTHQKQDGSFGPSKNPDPWPRFLMIQVLITHFEATNDPRVIPFIQKFFAFQLKDQAANPLKSWTKARGGEDLITIYWLYDRIQDPTLLKLAKMVEEQTTDWTGIFEKNTPMQTRAELDTNKYWDDSAIHTVNVCHGLKMPGLQFKRTGDERYKKALYNGIANLEKYNNQIFGLHAGDEKLGYKGCSRGSEYCEAVEYLHSMEYLIRLIGDPAFGDYLEKVAYNEVPVFTSPIGNRTHIILHPMK